ncbi:energy-coupled thiamine transporter ThiT [Clostridium sediminicola]|uniref:energy-coupled thiamine transporter ThiT n=1 Tax=Clostridium sediminicola TaxID=3114879 RepID=UPI0031F23541
MNIAIILAIIFTLAILVVSIKRLRGFKFEARVISRIGLVAAITIVLYMIKLVPFPQGGGCSLLSMLPIMILAVVFSTEEAIICAIIVASLKIIIQPPYYPLQIPLDYYGSMMAIAFTPMFGVFKKSELVAGALTASAISIFFSILSGVIFFGEFAPEGMNVWPYSIIYNVLGSGVEAILCVVVLAIIPLTNLKVLQLRN